VKNSATRQFYAEEVANMLSFYFRFSGGITIREKRK